MAQKLNIPPIHINRNAIRVPGEPNLEIDTSNAGKNLQEVSEFLKLVGELLVSPYVDNKNLAQLQRRISGKDETVIRNILQKIKKELEDTSESGLDEAQLSKALEKQVKKIFEEAFDNYVFEQKSGSFKGLSLSAMQLKSMLHGSDSYKEALEEFAKSIKDELLEKVTAEGTYDKDVREKVVELMAKVVNDLYKKIRQGGDQTVKDVVQMLEEAKENNQDLIDELIDQNRKFGKKVSQGSKKNMSLFKAFSETIVNNSKTYTRNVNLVRDVFIYKIKKSWQGVRDTYKKAVGKMYDAAYRVVSFMKASRNVLGAFGKDFKAILGIGKGGKGSRLGGLMSFGTRLFNLSVLGAYSAIRAASKIVTFAITGILTVFTFMVKIGFNLIAGIWKVGSALVKGAFNLTKGLVRGLVLTPIKTLTRGISGVYRFMQENVFMRKLYKFLRTDAGAVFLGTVAAYLKVNVVDPLFENFTKRDDLDLPEPE